MFQIRKMKPEDLGFVLSLVEDSGMERGKLLTNLESFLVCEDNHEKCGCGCIAADGSTGYMYWLAVNEGHRRKSLGSAIVKALINIAENNGIKEIYTPGGCDTFLKTLYFEETSPEPCHERLSEVLGLSKSYDIYKVSVEGYFKPCSS
jgi:N-acetylglutamate synthase-like GNAT family acetyltransferase